MKPSIPKGTRDFLPQEVRRRKYIFSTIEEVFKKYGFSAIETPTMEALETLTGKYGEEGDRLLFKVLNNGDYLAKANPTALENRDSKALTSSISKRGLRYDLTVPFARFVVMHQNELNFPFKRYQIQPVWRADRPQKGRYQEFYQCDADVVGSKSLMLEAELLMIYHEVFKSLNLNVNIQINNRKVLHGIAIEANVGDKFVEMTTAIDKMDKIGVDGVRKELNKIGITSDQIDLIISLLSCDKVADLKSKITNDIGLAGIKELEQCFSYLPMEIDDVRFTPTLARGLNYYTGCIMEVKAKDIQMGSIGGGGRYDDLTGVFGMKDMSGVGISFGAARIYDVMRDLELFSDDVDKDLDILLLAMDDESHRYAFKVLTQLRQEGFSAELYPEPAKMKKQMKYANGRAVPFVILIGSDECSSGLLTLKNMNTGEQEKLDISEITKKLTLSISF